MCADKPLDAAPPGRCTRPRGPPQAAARALPGSDPTARSAGRRRRWNLPATSDRDEAEAARRAERPVPQHTEARALIPSDNIPTDNSPEALEHAETGAPAPEQLEQSVPELGGAPVEETAPLFSDFDIHAEVVEALAEAGITRTFAIQELTLPLALAGHDLIGQARTGTGKTLGFGVPMLQRIVPPAEGADGVPQGLVVVPTRELCVQVARDVAAAGKKRGVRVQAIYGGRAYEPQVQALQRGVEIVVGTPGRLLDLAEQGHLVLGKVGMLVLDEADEMLDLGFLPDIERILGMVPDQRQTMLFSATMPGPIVNLARQFMSQPTHIRAHGNDEGSTVPETTQFVYRAHNLDKPELLARVLQARGRGLVMIFCRTKRTAQKVADDLVERGFAAAAVHGDLGQGAREQALRAFRSGKVDVLVATDVAARGIDVTGVTHVVNYQCPEDEKTYLHRIGRTGRAGADGVAVTLVDWDDVPRWQLINKNLGLDFEDPAETYSTSPWIRADLDIPEQATGRLPRAQRTREGLEAEELEDLGETGKKHRAGDRGARGGSASGPGREAEGEQAPRKSRPRRRTRGGGAAKAAAAAGEGPVGTAGGQEETAAKPRRRRRRGGANRGGGSESAA